MSSAGFNAGNYAKISINDVPVVFERNENRNFRGLHIVIINSKDGKVEMTKIFDTYDSSKEFEKFITQNLPAHSIVIAACQDECSKNLSDDVKRWFTDMGSSEVWDIGYRCSFAFIGVNSGGTSTVIEKKAETYQDKVWVS